jgi:hypothetical protein
VGEHRPLTDWDMALITVLCQEGETRCGERARSAASAGDRSAEKSAITDQWRYRTLRLKMFASAASLPLACK